MSTETKQIRVNIDELSIDADVDYGNTTHQPIQELEEWLNDVKAKGATHLDWYASSYEGESRECTATAFYLRDETAEEKAAREQKEREAKERKEQIERDRDYRLYISLKKQFESGQ